jgi:uncharacterized protein with PIN domain
MTPTQCPDCHADLAEPDNRKYSRVIGVVRSDRITLWRCPDCGAEWQRMVSALEDNQAAEVS